MKGKITLKILESLEKGAISTLDLLDVFLNTGYGTSVGKMSQELEKRQRNRDKTAQESKAKQRYNNLIYYLKKDGLITETKKDKRKIFRITNRGKEKLSKLKEIKMLPRISYRKEVSNQFTMVIFDIPEKDKRKRAWLRQALREMEFKMIQKSVWMGKAKLPRDFLDDLHRLDLINSVEIFEALKMGSLKIKKQA